MVITPIATYSRTYNLSHPLMNSNKTVFLEIYISKGCKHKLLADCQYFSSCVFSSLTILLY